MRIHHEKGGKIAIPEPFHEGDSPKNLK